MATFAGELDIMPFTDEILESLGYLARNYQPIAIVWHIILYSLILFLLLVKKKPTNRVGGSILAFSLLSVSFFAWQVDNPFNCVFFLITGFLLLYFSFNAESKEIILNPSFVLKATGVFILFFGLVYPHFLGPKLLVYLYAAPTGIIPCATLLMITGFSVMFLLRSSLKWTFTLLTANLFYGLFGVFMLHVYIDILLLFASCVLVIQLILGQKFRGNQYKQSPGKLSLRKATAGQAFLTPNNVNNEREP